MADRLPSPSVLLAALALLVALAGNAGAAFKLPANSVTTREVKNGSLLRADFRAGQVASAGPPIARFQETTIPAGSDGSVVARCQPGERVTGGGGAIGGDPGKAVITTSAPDASGQGTAILGWGVAGRNSGSSAARLTAVAACAR